MIIIGITGTNGAGKGTVVEYLVENKGFLHFSARDLLTKKLQEKNIEINRDNLVAMGNELRAKGGPSALIDLLFEEAKKKNQNCIIESIRTVGEIESLRSKGNFLLLGIDADVKLRYERVIKRGTATDKINFEEFLVQEKREMENNDVSKQNLKECIKRADVVLKNDSSIKDLENDIENIAMI
jgi:dephospho-CoA kinase